VSTDDTLLADRRVLVTGASGMVGAQVVADLVALGAHVVATDIRALPGRIRAAIDAGPGTVREVVADVTDPGVLEELVPGCFAVVHLAAVLRLAAERDPGLAFRLNLGATHRVFELATDEGVDRVVTGSSIAVYGDPPSPGHVFTEDDPQVGRSLYEVSKIACELYAEAFHRSRGLAYVPLRFGTLYGPGMTAAALVPRLLHGLLDDHDAGRTPRLAADPASLYDFVFTGDASRAVVRALTTSATCLPVNVVTGSSAPLGAMIDALMAELGSSVEPVWEPAASMVASVRRFDASRITDVLGFVPATPLAEGARAVVSWRANGSD
jgi:UDP-glucose 4-epimerase